ncbi:hypothetical protein RD792_002054 [Penstemon davidsonii]|uniref:DNA (cytosine-5-)-methyltransferase n=1 Tax=Penstemon davidsonii TaxID=160366 RepID=A0ABR0DR76_9LAMI|nr:hypothetical protein RD792_002054 [Penstemon davidsonii]
MTGCSKMGSTALLESNAAGIKEDKNKVVSASKMDMPSDKKQRKRLSSQATEDPVVARKMPKRAAACSDFKEKSLRITKKDLVLETKKDEGVEEEVVAVRRTAGQEDGRPCRRLTDFTFHNADGVAQPFEMIYSFLVVSCQLREVLEKKVQRESDVKVSGALRIGPYQASACIEVYKKLSKSCGGDPNISLEELLAGVVRSMSGMKCFSGGLSIKDFVVSQGDFIYNQLIGWDETSKRAGQLFVELPILAALRDESSKFVDLAQTHPGSLLRNMRIGPKYGDESKEKSSSISCPGAEEDDLKMARLLQEEENWRSMKQKKTRCSSSSSSKYYIKINEDEIADDYPLPAYYETSNEETDEYIIFGSGSVSDVYDIEDLPRSMLHDWALYNSDARLVPLELLPLKPCDEIDVTIYGSGVITADDGSGYIFDGESSHSTGASGAPEIEGIQVFLSAIKEWVIEFGSSMVFISIRTDMAWYRLGKPSKQYAPWYERILKTARLAISIITLLKEQIRTARLSFTDVIKRVSDFYKDHPAFISSKPEVVQRYIVVHGPIILQQFLEYPDDIIKKCAFVIGLTRKMEERHHSKWLVKKKKLSRRGERNLNPRAAIGSVAFKRKAMQATITRLINRIWGGYYSNYLPEESKEGIHCEVKEDAEIEEEEENEEQEENEEDDALEKKLVVPERTQAPRSVPSRTNSLSKEVNWDGQSLGKLLMGEVLYKRAVVQGDEISVRGAVLVQVDELHDFPAMYFVEYMFEKPDGSKMFHGRMMQRGCQTVLGNTANDREVFLTNKCMDFKLKEVKESITVDIRSIPWGHQHRKANEIADKADRARAEERKKKGLPTEYYCKSLYSPERGAFFALPYGLLGLGSGSCQGCRSKEADNVKERFKLDEPMNSFVYRGIKYYIDDYVYVSPYYFSAERDGETFKGGRNVGLKAYAVCQLLEICDLKQPKRGDADSVQVRVRRFFRPDDISVKKAYTSDIREVYYSEEMHTLPLDVIEGKCEIRKKKDLKPHDVPSIFDNVFFCEYLYDPLKGSIKQPNDDTMSRKNKGKYKEGEIDLEFGKQEEASQRNRLTTLDIFAGCGGLSEGLHQSGVSFTKWAIEYEAAAGDAFKLNHPGALVFVNNCNVILRAAMQKCGDADDCISTPEAAELAASLNKEEVDNLPLPGQVDFITGGPPCQVRFGILEAGAYGVPQSRKRAFIWAASPEEQLPDWPEPMHVFAAPQLKISMSKSLQYSAVRSTSRGAPFRSLTVRDAIEDLPPVGNGASKTMLEYQGEPISWFQKKIRGSMDILNDHISKEMNEINLIRCQRIPMRPGADWRALPDEKVKLSTGEVVDLRPMCLKNNTKKHNQWKGLFGRGKFSNFHYKPPTNGLYSFMQGFPDSYKFSGTTIQKHRQIGNAVPPPLAYAIARKLKEAVESKRRTW